MVFEFIVYIQRRIRIGKRNVDPYIVSVFSISNNP